MAISPTSPMPALAGVDGSDPAGTASGSTATFSIPSGGQSQDGVYSYHVELPIMTIMQAWENQGGTGELSRTSRACMGLRSEPRSCTLTCFHNNNPDVWLPAPTLQVRFR